MSDLIIQPIETLEIRNLTIHNGGGGLVLKQASFVFDTNTVSWIASSEGAGKTTLLQSLACLSLPIDGEYLINGKDVLQLSFEEFLPYRLSIGYSFDYGGLLHNKSLRENLLLPLIYHQLCSDSESESRVDNLLKRFELLRYAHERPSLVPGRVRKILVVLRSMITYPSLLLLDDPAVGLDDEMVANFVDLIFSLRRAGHLRTILISAFDDRFLRYIPYKTVKIDHLTLVSSSKKQLGLAL